MLNREAADPKDHPPFTARFGKEWTFMNLLHLQYFKALAEREHLFRTASELYISPSALSTSISRLEAELGVRLFDRVGRNIRLNDNGRRFYRHVKLALEELELGKLEIQKADAEGAASLRIATSTQVFWQEPFAEFVRKNRGVSFSHNVVTLDQLANSALMMPFDFIITALGDISAADYEYEILFNDSPVLAVYEEHPWADRRQISLIEAKDEPFVAPTKDFSSRRYFDNLCSLADFTPHIVAQGDYELRARLIKKHIGITITTAMAAAVRPEGLRFIEITEPVHSCVQAIFWKKNVKLSPHAEAFRQMIVDHYAPSAEAAQP